MKTISLDNNGYNFIGVTLNNDASNGIFAVSKKASAVAFAKKQGWHVQDVKRAYNRFFVFYIVGQLQGNTFRILCKDGSWIDFDFSAN